MVAQGTRDLVGPCPFGGDAGVVTEGLRQVSGGHGRRAVADQQVTTAGADGLGLGIRGTAASSARTSVIEVPDRLVERGAVGLGHPAGPGGRREERRRAVRVRLVETQVPEGGGGAERQRPDPVDQVRCASEQVHGVLWAHGAGHLGQAVTAHRRGGQATAGEGDRGQLGGVVGRPGADEPHPPWRTTRYRWRPGELLADLFGESVERDAHTASSAASRSLAANASAMALRSSSVSGR